MFLHDGCKHLGGETVVFGNILYPWSHTSLTYFFYYQLTFRFLGPSPDPPDSVLLGGGPQESAFLTSSLRWSLYIPKNDNHFLKKESASTQSSQVVHIGRGSSSWTSGDPELCVLSTPSRRLSEPCQLSRTEWLERKWSVRRDKAFPHLLLAYKTTLHHSHCSHHTSSSSEGEQLL